MIPYLGDDPETLLGLEEPCSSPREEGPIVLASPLS
jgi:hypothetical protein